MPFTILEKYKFENTPLPIYFLFLSFPDNVTVIRDNVTTRPRGKSAFGAGLARASSLPSPELRFSVELEQGTTLEFAAPTRQEKARWIAVLCRATELEVEVGSAPDASFSHVGILQKQPGGSLALKKWQSRTFKLRETEPKALSYYDEKEILKGQILISDIKELRSFSMTGASDHPPMRSRFEVVTHDRAFVLAIEDGADESVKAEWLAKVGGRSRASDRCTQAILHPDTTLASLPRCTCSLSPASNSSPSRPAWPSPQRPP